MKPILTTILLVAVLLLFNYSSCNKSEIKLTELPPATQTGANTLGFLLNGQPWVPKGQVGVSANLAIDVDFGFDKGIFNISAYKTGTPTEYFAIGVKGSLNLMTFPQTLAIGRNTLANARFSNGTCSITFFDSTVYRSGTLVITKLDKASKIIAGKFNVLLYKNTCTDTLRITNGTFDMKY